MIRDQNGTGWTIVAADVESLGINGEMSSRFQIVDDRTKLVIAARSTEQFHAGPVSQRPLTYERLTAGAAKHVVTAQHQLFQRLHASQLATEIRRHVVMWIRIVKEHLVVLPLRQIGQGSADTAQADDADVLTSQHSPAQES